MRSLYADPSLHAWLMTIVEQRLGDGLMAQAEAAKIRVAEGQRASIALDALQAGLQATLTEPQALSAIEADLERIVQAGVETVCLTSGSTGPAPLARRIAAPFGRARTVRGDRLASVAQGLGLHAQRVFGRP